MTYILGERTVKRTIKVHEEGDLGKPVVNDFELEFTKPTVKQEKKYGALQRAWFEALTQLQQSAMSKESDLEGQQDNLANAEQALIDFIAGFVKGWAGVADPDGKEVPFSEEGFEELVSYRDALTAVSNNFRKLILGQKEVQEKNSESSASTGETLDA